MCLRMRRNGWRIWSNGAEMTWHDVAIDRMSQWWSRSRRAGFAFSQLVDRHGSDADPAWPRLVRSAQLWTLMMLAGLAGMVIAGAMRSPPIATAAAVPALAVALQVGRMTASKRARLGIRGAFAWTCLIMIAKVAQVQGWLQYRRQRRSGRPEALIEYKS